MESKKINQLATELAPDLSDLTIIGDPTTGISKKITLSQMASLFTGTVEEYANFAAFPLVGVADTIYIAKDTNVIYRWDSTAYVVLSPNVIASLVFNDANGFDGTIALVGSVATLTITTALTSGSVPFIGASGALTQDNSNLFFDDTNNRLGIATASPTTPLDVFGSGIIGRLNATSTNNSFLGFSSNGTNKWSAGNVQSDHRFRIFSEANSAELITILQTGEFGIGIANPTTKLHIDGGASALIANLDANVSVAKSLSFRSDNSNRINLEVSGTESGSNAGANFFIRTFTDAGSLLATPITITRSTGVVSIPSLALADLTGILPVANGGTGLAALTSNYLYKGNGTSALAQSIIYDNGTKILIGSTTADFGILDITTSNAVGFTSALGIGFRTNVAEGDSVGISFKTKISLSGTIWENARIAAISESIATSANGALAFYTMNATTLAEKMRITPSGLVGIGTSSPDFPLTVKTDASANSIKILGRSSGDTSISWNSADNLTQYVHLDIGSAYTQLYSNSNLQIFASTNQATNGAYNTFGNLYVASTSSQGTDIGGSISIGGKFNGAGAYATFARIQGKKENSSSGQTGGYLAFETCTDVTNNNTERMRVLSNGDVCFGKTVYDNSTTGVSIADTKTTAIVSIVTDSGVSMLINRKTNDGDLVVFRQDGTTEGSISVSGTTISYNSFLGSHWSQLIDNSKPEIFKGTVLETIDELCIWENENNDRLAKIKISDTFESKNVYGIFLDWDNDDIENNDMFVAAVGAGYIRINGSENISMGDLLQSNGDGTAKIQSDDIMRSSTIAKVVSTKKIETYEDGSYLIAATLHCG